MATPTNPNAVHGITPLIGTSLQRRTNSTTETNPIEFALGTTTIDGTAKAWIYVQASGAIGSNASVTILFQSAGSIMALSVLGKTTQYCINGTAAFADQDYGWVQNVRRLGETNYKP